MKFTLLLASAVLINALPTEYAFLDSSCCYLIGTNGPKDKQYTCTQEPDTKLEDLQLVCDCSGALCLSSERKIKCKEDDFTCAKPYFSSKKTATD